ncbi:MAG: DUF4145 domain-containing protein [Planctomycetaceae bacterium]|nr:DUF4145 domain-containing protein [Planctomycetaceae bacterium]
MDRELEQLLQTGTELIAALNGDDKQKKGMFVLDYQPWYTQAVRVVEILIPDRVSEFRGYYEINPKRKQLDYGSYVIQDYCKSIRPAGFEFSNFDSASRATTCLINQLAILRSVKSRSASVIANLQATILADVRDLELETAQELQKTSLRAAGALAGVVLERHLQQTCDTHKLTFRKQKPTLSDYSESLKQANVIDVAAWRKLSYLADIRNICCHSKGDDPTGEQVKELIDGVNWAIKTIV